MRSPFAPLLAAITIVCACACLMAPSAQAAKAPMSLAALATASDTIVIGQVVKVEMKIEKAKRCRALGSKDKVHTLTCPHRGC